MRRPSLLSLALSIVSEARRSAVPVASVTMPATASPYRFLHRGVAHVAELRLPPGRLAVKSAVGIGRARMRVVLALLPMEVGPAVIIAAAVLGAEALL